MLVSSSSLHASGCDSVLFPALTPNKFLRRCLTFLPRPALEKAADRRLKEHETERKQVSAEQPIELRGRLTRLAKSTALLFLASLPGVSGLYPPSNHSRPLLSPSCPKKKSLFEVALCWSAFPKASRSLSPRCCMGRNRLSQQLQRRRSSLHSGYSSLGSSTWSPHSAPSFCFETAAAALLVAHPPLTSLHFYIQ
jgi:hypothetical protein